MCKVEVTWKAIDNAKSQAAIDQLHEMTRDMLDGKKKADLAPTVADDPPKGPSHEYSDSSDGDDSGEDTEDD